MVGTTLFQDMVLLSSFYDINDSKRELILLDTVSAVSLMQLLNKINQELTEQKDGYWPCRSRSYFIELLFFLEGLRCNESLQKMRIILGKNKIVLYITSFSISIKTSTRKLPLNIWKKHLHATEIRLIKNFKRN